jgi:alpha-1,6-mannosyltransferase
MNSLSRSRAACASVGLAGSLLIAVAGPAAVGDRAWWYAPALPRAAATAMVYAGMALLSGAWLVLGRYASGDQTRWLKGIAAVWLVPLAVAPALFSRDVYSYLAQGAILQLGHDPYNTPPAALAGLGDAHLLSAVSSFWRHTTAPYGPLFLGLMSVIVTITGSHLVAGVLFVRLLELVGVALLAICVPRLAGALGADPGRAVWLAVISPLLAFELVAGAHNDVLMAGLLVAGVTVALRGRPVTGVALCALAATVKLPALAGAVFIVVAWARAEPKLASRAAFVLQAAFAALGVIAIVSVVTGVGFSWLTTSLFSTPAKVHLAITPSTAAGWTLADVLRALGIGVGHRTVSSAFGAITLAITAGAGLVLLYRLRIRKLVPYLGLLLLIAAAGGPAAWPWYFVWGLVLLAACPGLQCSVGLAVGAAVAPFLIKPDGILALPVQSAPAVLAAYLLLALLAWRAHRGGPRVAPVASAARAGIRARRDPTRA